LSHLTELSKKCKVYNFIPRKKWDILFYPRSNWEIFRSELYIKPVQLYVLLKLKSIKIEPFG